MKSLLSVDLGLKTGLALYGEDGRLLWYRSHNLGATDRLRRAAHVILQMNRYYVPGYPLGYQVIIRFRLFEAITPGSALKKSISGVC